MHQRQIVNVLSPTGKHLPQASADGTVATSAAAQGSLERLRSNFQRSNKLHVIHILCITLTIYPGCILLYTYLF